MSTAWRYTQFVGLPWAGCFGEMEADELAGRGTIGLTTKAISHFRKLKIISDGFLSNRLKDYVLSLVQVVRSTLKTWKSQAP